MRGLSTLNRKLLRDLWQIKGQALAIALVIGGGISVYVLMFSTFESLERTRDTYYDRYRLGDVFANLKRAPLGLAEEIRTIPGVAEVETRVVADVTLDVPGFNEPAVGRLVSIPAGVRPALCDVHLTKGRYIEPGHADEVLLSDTFAAAHNLQPGDTVGAVINGRRRNLRIAGLALSPEYIYNIRPGEMLPDEKRFGLLWMERRGLAAAWQMEGGFNDVVLQLMRGASERAVIDDLDRLLEPYGGIGAIPLSRQPSNWYLENELLQLKGMGTTLPFVFLGVAAFLLNVVLTRVVSMQREQIGAMKALGWDSRSIALHYVQWAVTIALAGSVIGLALGIWLGRGMTVMYTDFFHFPIIEYVLSAKTLVAAVATSLVAAVLGAWAAVRRVVSLPPAEAMRPEPPPTFRRSIVERIGLRRWLSQPTRIIARSLERRPWRAALSAIGIAFSVSLLVLGTFSQGSVDELMEYQFGASQRYDLTVAFAEPASPKALYELQRLPGVLEVETFRAVPVRFRSGHRFRESTILGLPARSSLNRVVDASWATVELPPEGIAMSSKLAEMLAIGAGDTVTVDVREGRRPVREVLVTAVIDDYMGTSAYMEIGALRRMMREGDTFSGAYLRVDDAKVQELYRQLRNTPAAAGVTLKDAALLSFNQMMDEMMGVMRLVYALFAGVIALGVVYNSARISLAERARELATLRVIGFTRGEITYVLLGELAVIVCASIPVGLLLGYGMAAGLVEAMSTEVWRMPLVVNRQTLLFATSVTLVSAVLSAWLVRRKLDNLDLVEALKLRE
jgi:putative ABC transport system permease protein